MWGADRGLRLSAKRRLSDRESDVVRLLRAGKPYKSIAYELGIAESTARVLGSRALRKCKRTRMQIIPI